MRFFIFGAGVCVAAGLAVLFGFCQGTSGMSLANPLTQSSLHIDVTASGVPMLSGLGLTALGALFFAVAWVASLSGMFTRRQEVRRREEPFRD